MQASERLPGIVARTTMEAGLNCPDCQLRTMHGGCPMEVFDFDQGRYMCDTYLDSFTD